LWMVDSLTTDSWVQVNEERWPLSAGQAGSLWRKKMESRGLLA